MQHVTAFDEHHDLRAAAREIIDVFQRLYDGGQDESRQLSSLISELSALLIALQRHDKVTQLTGKTSPTLGAVIDILDQCRGCLAKQQHVLRVRDGEHARADSPRDSSSTDHELATLRAGVFHCCLLLRNLTLATIFKAAFLDTDASLQYPRSIDSATTSGSTTRELAKLMTSLTRVWSMYRRTTGSHNTLTRQEIGQQLDALEQSKRLLVGRSIAFVGLETHPLESLTIPELILQCTIEYQQTVVSIETLAVRRERDTVWTRGLSSATQCKTTIRLARHEDIEADQYQMFDDHCRWLDADGATILEHVFSKPIQDRFPWKTAGTHSAWTVAFTTYQMAGSQIKCNKLEHAKHFDQAPEYVFVNEDDYKLFQGKMRQRMFLDEYEMPSIKSKGTMTTHTSKGEFAKIWSGQRDDTNLTVTIPVTFGGYQVRNIELLLRWLTCEKRGTTSIRLEFKHIMRQSSEGTPPPGGASEVNAKSKPFYRRLSGLAKVVSSSSSPSILDEKDVAPAAFTENFQHFLLEFRDRSTRDDFARLFEPQGPARLLSSTASSQSISSSTLALPIHSTSQTTGTSTSAAYGSMSRPSSIQQSNLLLPDAFAHSVLRRGPAPQPATAYAIREREPACNDYYKDLPVDPETIRLLRINPGRSGSFVAVFLEQHTLSDAPQFEALSYCWQKTGGTRQLEAGGLEGFRVSEHVWNALRRLRHRDRVRFVWIDAICINQDNIDERNNQILLMPKIYSQAFRAIIWIGDSRPEVTTCLRCELAEDEVEPTLCALPGLSALEHEDVSQDLRKDLLALQETDDQNDLAAVWWKRLYVSVALSRPDQADRLTLSSLSSWCIQEFRFSKRPPTVYIGPHAIGWQHFCELFDNNNDPLVLFHGLRESMDSPSLFSLLAMTGRFRCTDPRDRIFALLGMTPRASEVLTADYRRSVIRVIEEACLYLINESSSLDVLLDKRTSRSTWSLGAETVTGIIPTWIPDLTCLQTALETRSWDSFKAGPRNAVARLAEEPNTRTAADAEFDIPRMLHIKAVYFGKIRSRTRKSDIADYERSPDACVIYNSLLRRGEIIDKILNVLQYDYRPHELYATHRDLDPSPCLGRLMLYYVFEGRRSMVEEFMRRSQGPLRDIVESYDRQEKEDLAYVEAEGSAKDAAYVKERWNLKISRAEAREMMVPERMQAALATESRNVVQDFLVARDLENLFAFARRSTNRYYFTGTNYDAPMRRDVLRSKNLAEVRRLRTQYDSQARGLEFHEYDAKYREQDFFKTEPGGFLGLGPACLEENDIVIVPFGSSRPLILRQCKEWEGENCFKLIGECIVPSIMSGRWMQGEMENAVTYRLK